MKLRFVTSISSMSGISFVFVLILLFVACSSSNCRRKEKIPPFDSVAKEAVNKDLTITTPKDKAKGQQTVFVYKYDGSLQCGMGKVIPLDAMVKELEGIKIISKESRHDGLMHIQACGTITGQANVYEIPKKDFPQAKEKGFRLWEFN